MSNYRHEINKLSATSGGDGGGSNKLISLKGKNAQLEKKIKEMDLEKLRTVEMRARLT